MKRLIQRKSVQDLVQENHDHESHGPGKAKFNRTLTGFNLTMIGVGAIVGAGIFSVTGSAAAYYAGPGIVYSFLIAGALCAFAGLCYAELAAMIPVSGSAYTYTYATMGEFIAWIIGWDLILEYALGGVAIAIAWSGYALSLIGRTLGIQLPDSIMVLTKGPWELVSLSNGTQVNGIWNLPATFIAILISCIVYRGIRESVRVNNIIVLIKLLVIFAFVGLGWAVLDSTLWIANSGGSGLAKLIPLAETTLRNGAPINSFGWSGVLTGAGVAFFSYIGFDMISTMSQECKNPSKSIPFGIIMSLLICTVLYVIVSLVMTGVVPFRDLGVADPLALGIDRIVSQLNWSREMQKSVTFLVKAGALAGLTSGLLICLIGQSRIFYVMSKDGLLPFFDKIHPKYGTPHWASAATAVFVSGLAGVMPISLVGELVSIGTLLAFFLVCIGVPILRFTSPEVERPFKVPCYWLTSLIGAGTCIWVMSGLPLDTWKRLFFWMLFGFIFYFIYGIRKSKLTVNGKKLTAVSVVEA